MRSSRGGTGQGRPVLRAKLILVSSAQASPMTPAVRAILFVCLGNICRSPTAEGVMRELLRREGLGESFTLDSAGTGAWHVGESPDPRASAAARARGIVLSGHARQIEREDFKRFDLIVAMDRANLRDLQRLAPDDGARAKVQLLRDFDPAVKGPMDVPDPYYGGEDGFERVLDLTEDACRGLLVELRLSERANLVEET
jgi:protein-tyrosine phosphatase